MLFDFVARYSTANPVEKPSRAFIATMRARRVVTRTLLRVRMVSKRLLETVARRRQVPGK
jgi:hypothetical protein